MGTELLEKIRLYNPNVDEELIHRAMEFCMKAHEGQLRSSGEPYYTHPFQVAMILADLNMDEATIVAGLLHDVLEDSDYTYDQMVEMFGEEITSLVDGVTKLKRLKFRSKQESQAENIRKMLLAMATDIRVIIIKFADRLHNLRTLEYMSSAQQYAKATESIEIYAPIAHRLGINAIKWEMEDLSLRYIEPAAYYEIAEKLAKRREEREQYIEKIIKELDDNLEAITPPYEITGRPKSIYSIFKKMQKQKKSFEEIFDVTAIRVLLQTENDCYSVLGVVHSLWKPIPGRFKDYIALPKPNLYQSLHTTVIGPQGEMFEVQIRTYDMHKTAEYGIAAHWKYKEGSSKSDNFDEKLTWLRQIIDWQKDLQDSNEFVEVLKGDFLSDEVYVFSPKGDVINLPIGSTPIDFAYRVHSAVGNHCIGAKIDGRIVPLDYKLKNGNIVEIITSANTSGPSADWLKIVKSSQAKTKIKQWFKKEQRDLNMVKGRDLLEKEVRRQGYKYSEILKDEWLDKIRERLSFQQLDDMFASIGYGSTQLTQVLPKLKEYHKDYYKKEPSLEELSTTRSEPKKKTSSTQGIILDGVDNLQVKFSRCCNPVPGDEILGYVTRGRGVSIHRLDCPNMKEIDKDRLIDVKWDENINTAHDVNLMVLAYDRVGYLLSITKVISELGLNLGSLNARKNKDGTFEVNLIIEIKNKEEIDLLIRKLKQVEGTVKAYRVKA